MQYNSKSKINRCQTQNSNLNTKYQILQRLFTIGTTKTAFLLQIKLKYTLIGPFYSHLALISPKSTKNRQIAHFHNLAHLDSNMLISGPKQAIIAVKGIFKPHGTLGQIDRFSCSNRGI